MNRKRKTKKKDKNKTTVYFFKKLDCSRSGQLSNASSADMRNYVDSTEKCLLIVLKENYEHYLTTNQK